MMAVQLPASVDMLRLCSLGVITILLAGGVSSFSLPIDEGDEFPIFVDTSLVLDDVETCILEPPHGETFKFKPVDRTRKYEKYQIQAKAHGMACYVIVTNADSSDEGIWTMTFDHENATSQSVTVTVNVIGGVSSDTFTRYEGGEFPLFVLTSIPHVETCILEPPNAENFKFKPGDISNKHEKYQIQATQTGMPCFVTVTNLDSNDEGKWTLTFDHENATSRSVRVTVNVKESVESEEDEDAGIVLLSLIRHSTRIGLYIDISLDKQSGTEECYVRPPGGELTKSDAFRMENVTVQKSSNYVSCRITLGPMTETLLGEWRLCGKTAKDEMRCQPANIVWNNNGSPGVNWGLAVQDVFSHPVHFGGSVNPGVVGIGNAETCHVITPNGEDLVITWDVKYPHIQRIAFDRPTLCSINFTDIDASSIGDWTIYGKFRALSIGLNEVHLPLRFFLYNEEQPFEQAYNVTTLPEDRHLVILGHALVVSVTSVGQVDNCQYRMPTGQSNDLTSAIAPAGVVLESLASPTACQIIFNPTTKDMLGEWQLIGKFSNGNQFTERRQTFRIIEEDPANPIIEDFREVQYLSPLIFNTELEASHTVTISSSSLIENESCHLLTPDGLQYAFIDGFHVPNVEIIGGGNIECGVEVDVLSLDMIGQWTLIARGSQHSSPNHIERRRKFTIRIEEISSLGNAITIIEGADLYVSLPNATHMYHTCKLYGPNHEEVEEFEVDSFRYSSCGFTVRNVTRAQSGMWSIVYGNQITYISNVEVKILASPELFVEDFTWTEGDFVNITIGPQDAVYCRILDTDYNHIFDGFSPCRILLDRVTMAHKGWWSIAVGLPGSVILFREGFIVNVKSHDKPVVTTSIVKNGTSILLTCSVPAENEVESCLFRDPHSNLFLASHGVGQGGYSGIALRYELDTESHDCSLRLLALTPGHIGRWRCAVDTAIGTSFGFLHVTNETTHDDFSKYYYTPSLTPTVSSVTGPEGMPAIMSCAIDTSISYCYFRAPNGTVFNVGPSISSEGFEYVGMGLDAGECGIRFDSLWHNDTGYWTCHVGLFDQFEEESAGIPVEVYEPLKMYHGWQGSTVTLRLAVGGWPKLEYCRFLRSDGLLFKSDSSSSGYYFDQYRMQSGICDLTITDPIQEDLQPWTVFAKAIGSEGEVSMTSTFQCPPQYFGGGSLFMGILLWTLFGIVSVMMILACIGLIPKKNREWTYRRASSIRNSLRKQPPPVNRDNTMIY